MADLHLHRDHTLGLPRARKVALKWAEDVEEKLDMSARSSRATTRTCSSSSVPASTAA